jgi:hypothetical protein
MSLAEHFYAFGQSAERDGGTTYGAICRGVAEDPWVFELMAHAAPAQQRPNLLLAAVHYLLLRDAPDPLAAYYDTVDTADPERPPISVDVAETFRRFCLSHHDELVELIATRSTQTNEVGRCAALMPALCQIAAEHGNGRALSLLDLGTSAGLNLLFDDYGYRYRQRSDGALLAAGARASEVQIDCTVRRPLTELPALDLPPIGSRVGLDQDPIDPTSDDEALWLLACLWPDNLPRFSRLQGALEIARSTTHPPRLVRGDIIDDLDEVAGSIEATGPLVIFHSWVAAYLTEARQRDLVEAVRALSASRPVHHLYAESFFDTPGLPTPPSPHPRSTSDLATALVHIGDDRAAPVRLADMHPHGSWLTWWPRPTGPRGRPVGPAPAPPPH